jgi:CheY-like chemotaxis protein
MAAKCPLFHKASVLCRIKAESQHRWVGNEQTWYLSNYCASDYFVDCADYEAYLEQQAITKGKILVVDDETDFLETLNSFFSLRGYQMVTATSAEKALRLIAQEEPALALVDIKLPGLNGIELVKILKDKHPEIRIFVITAYDEEHKKAVEDLGVDAFFAKPVGLDQLKKKVVHVLASADPRQQPTANGQALEGTPKAKLLFIQEVLPNEEDRLTPYLRDYFSDPSQAGGIYQIEFAHSVSQAQDKLMSFKPDIALINFDSFYETPCGQVASRVMESPYRPKEVLVFGLNLEATDKQKLESLGIQYVDQRKSFAKLITTVKQTALRHGLDGRSL